MSYLITIINEIRIFDIVDIIILSVIFYKIYTVINYTRAIQLLKGVALILIILPISSFLNLRMLNFLFKNVITLGALALVVIFQPELRRALEYVGRSRVGLTLFGSNNDKSIEKIDEIVKAVSFLSQKHIGALIVMENLTGLKEIIKTGVTVNADISNELIQNIFAPNAALHDGAIVIRKNKILAAGCVLPLTNNVSVSSELGTRHRAAIGISLHSDAFVIIVSEETGVISIANGGSLNRFVEFSALKELIIDYYNESYNKKSVKEKILGGVSDEKN